MASKHQPAQQQGQGNSKNEKLKAIAKDVRSVMNSRKPPCYLNDVLNDYKTILDVPLPYRALGYKTPEELLLDTGDFQITKINGRTSIYALHASEASKHIKDMVLRQKKSKNAPKALRKPRAPNHPVYHRSSSGGDRNNNQLRMNHNLQQPMQQRQMMQQKKQQSQPQQQQQYQQQKMQKNNNNNNTNNNNNNTSDYDLRMRLDRIQLQQQEQQQLRQKQAQEQQLRQQQLLRQQQQQQQQQQQMKNNQNINSKPRPILGNGVPTNQQQSQPQQQQQQKELPNQRAQLSIQKSLTNIQDRLKVTTISNNQVQQQAYTKAPPLRQQMEQKVMNVQPVLPPKVFQFNPNLDPIKSLSQYCIVRQFTQPQYKTINNRKKYQCRVQVNGSIYSTYPNDYNSEHEAEMACAQIAVEQIQQQEARNPLPVCMDGDDVLVDKLYKELLKHTCGIFVKNMPETFENAYQQALPDHWWTLVQMSKCFITECLAGDKVVILANLQVSSQNNATKISSQSNGFKKPIKVELEKLRLPWEDKHWNVHVTYVESAVKVYARLIGNEYSDQYDAICKTMESEAKTPANKVLENEIYLAFVSEGWHRVRIISLEENKGRALCYYLDFGDSDWLPIIQLYVCDAKYLILPAQAVALSLFGLEDFQEHPSAHSILYNHLQNNTLVAEILCKEFDYAEVQKSVKVVLFDTNSDVDINMNSELLQMICNAVGPPELKSSGITKVQVTAVNDNGDLYVRVLGSSLNYVEKMINQLVASKFKREQHCVDKMDLQRSEMFLICDNSNEANKSANGSSTEPRWYRGKLSNKQQMHASDVFDIYYVDHGYTHSVHISQMFRLDSLSTALSKFPAQAIAVQLHNIPPITKSIVGRMRALLPANCEALVKLVQPAQVPYVTVYRRIEGPDTLCTINDTIRIEYELESSLDTNTDFTGAVEVNSAHSSNASINKIETNSTPSKVYSNNVPKTKVFNQNFKSDDDLKNLSIYNEIPIVGSFFDVRVALASNPTNFIVQPHLKYKELCALMKELQIYCEQNSNNNVVADQIQIGQAYAAKNPDGYYHRVIVEKIFNTDMINVRYCDFGDMAVLRYTELKYLPATFRHLPQMAIAAKLYDAHPIDGDWTMNDCTRFRELTVGKKFVGVINGISKESHNDILLDLELIDVETEDDIYIKQVLQAEKRLK